MKRTSGQIIVGALVLLLLIAILVPALIRYSEHETQWTMKQQRSSSAFDLAETAVERGYTQLLISTTSWKNALSGIFPAGYKFDQPPYTDMPSGTYEIRMSTGGPNQVIIIGVAKDKTNHEVRAVKAIYSNLATGGNNSVNATNTISVNSTTHIEWGAIVSHNNISLSAPISYPRLFSAAGISPSPPYNTSGTPPITDGKQWWAFQTNLPAIPQLDLAAYKSLAQGYSASGIFPPAGCPATYYIGGGMNFQGCKDTSGRVYYAGSGGNVVFQDGGSGNFVEGSVIAEGGFQISGNGGDTRTDGDTATVPQTAWLEYGATGAWAHYQCFDPGVPYGSWAAAKAANYQASGVSYTFPGPCLPGVGNVILHGLAYSGGGSGLQGGGTAIIHGVVYTPDQVSTSNSFTLVLDDNVAANVLTKNVSISRIAWQEVLCDWSGSNPVCP